MNVKLMASGATYQVLECGHLLPLGMEPCDELIAGEVGYFTASIKNVKDTQVGDTITGADTPAAEPLPGYRPARTPRTAVSTPTCGTPWRSSSSTTPPCPSSRNPPPPWASASAAAFWACSTWRSSRSGWSGNLTWT